MLSNTIDDIKRENAEFLRDVEYVKETALDDELDARMDVAERAFNNTETYDELSEAADAIDNLSDYIDPAVEEAEIDRILNCNDEITFEEMAGIE